MNTFVLLCASVLLVPAAGFSYEKAFEETRPGRVEVKTIPASKVIAAYGSGNYFAGGNQLFGRLFSYIQKNDVAMTVPVKADIEPGSMFFYIGASDLDKALSSSSSVEVLAVPELQVISMGVRGGYSENNFLKAREQLSNQLDASEDWKPAGEAYAIFWNGPYVPGFMKRFEVHIPVERVSDKKP